MSASKKSMTDSGRSTSDRSGWVAYMKRRAGSWITSAEQLAERVGITRECVTNQLITKCHLSSELFTRTYLSEECALPPSGHGLHKESERACETRSSHSLTPIVPQPHHYEVV